MRPFYGEETLAPLRGLQPNMANMKKLTPWILTVVASTAAVFLLLPSSAGDGHLPDPPADAQALAMPVKPATHFTAYPDIAEAYDIARQVPQTLDSLYCHCHCKESMRHRSLLTCFQGEHASQCDICMGEARLAAQMMQQGRTLDEIR